MAERQYPARQVGDILRSAIGGSRTTRRHPAEVTSDRLGDAVTRWGSRFTAEELDMIGQIRARLEEIAEQAGGDAGS